LFRWLFAMPGLVLWFLLVTAAGVVVVARADDLSSPVLAMLDGNNVYMLFAALIGLKVVHEFGHAYACRAFGGHVPEMGVFLVLFTPLAYVDATDSWTFSKTHRRAIVTLGGVYFESVVGAIAVFVWAMTEPSAINTLAYQVMILSTVTTALFNLNPLLRYDAYYLVSDLSGIPNLKARCQEAVAELFKRVCFGLRTDLDGQPLRPSPGLALFGFAQMGYRAIVMLTISTVLVMKFGGLGIILAIVLNGITILKGLMTIVRYVISSAEVAAVRSRAIIITAGAFVVAIAGISILPVPYSVDANGVVSFEDVTTIRAPQRGIVIELEARTGSLHKEGDRLAVIGNEDIRARLGGLKADAETGHERVLLASLSSPGDAVLELAIADRIESHLDQVDRDIAELQMRAPASGRILEMIVPNTGVYIQRGDPVMIFGSGDVEAVFHVRAVDFKSIRLAVGDRVVCRSPAYPARDIVGYVTHIGGVGARDIEPRIARAVPQGLVPMNSATGTVVDAFFEVHLRLSPADAEFTGSLLKAKLPAQPITVAQMLERRIKRSSTACGNHPATDFPTETAHEASRPSLFDHAAAHSQVSHQHAARRGAGNTNTRYRIARHPPRRHPSHARNYPINFLRHHARRTPRPRGSACHERSDRRGAR
jgi:putative peptide zinc metalloprotease protein